MIKEAREWIYGEPWQFDEENHGIDSDPGWGLLDECSSHLGVSVHTYNRYSKLFEEEQWEKAKAKAKRIVACVNACAGMENPGEEIEAMAKRETRLVDALERIITGDKGDWSCNCPSTEIATQALTHKEERG